MADEALKCFASLLESVPGWIADLENILKTATERQQEILFENQPAHRAEAQENIPEKLPNSSSLESKRSRDDDGQGGTPAGREAAAVDRQIPHMTQSDALRLAQRKRKTASVCSGRDSGPLKYRSKSMVVVYYDGETQKRFEAIVRAIGISRNSLRKGKTSAKVDFLSRRGFGRSGDSDDEDDELPTPRMELRVMRKMSNPASSKDDGTAVFDQIDGFLEKAQAMCERAAHQVLRDGDCALEIKHAKAHFIGAQKLGEAEIPSWQKRAEQAAETERRSEERRKAEEEEGEDGVAKNRPSDYSSNEKLMSDDDPFSSPDILEVDLEAEDSDADDGREFAVKVLQLGSPYTKRHFMQSSRLAAH